jgi:hypothetical protein
MISDTKLLHVTNALETKSWYIIVIFLLLGNNVKLIPKNITQN